jgi:hypothetical protein
MRRNIFLILLLFNQFAYSQIKVGKWRDHFSYNNCIAVCRGGDKIYGATSTGVFWYNIDDGEVGKISRVQGLNDINILTIEYSEQNNVLAIGYEDGNIDFVFKDRILNMPQIKDKLMQGSKRINNFTFYNNLVFVSTDFGIVAINLSKEEIKDTYFVGDMGVPIKVYRTAILNDNIYAATEAGLLLADVNDPLLIQYQRWIHETGFSSLTAECTDVAILGQKVIAIEGNSSDQKDIIWAVDGGIWLEVGRPYNTVSHIRTEQSKLFVASNEGISSYATVSSPPVTLTSYNFTWLFEPNMAIALESGKIAIADRYSGIVYGTYGDLSSIYPNGPANNRTFSIGVSSEKVIVACGAYDEVFGNLYYPLAFHQFENQQWKTTETGDYNDAIKVVFNPSNPSEYYILSWGAGIFQYRNNELLNHYSPTNSTLQTIYPNLPYCRISGVAFDNGGNLWVANVLVPNPISVRKTDGSWYSFPYLSVINSDHFSDLIYSPTGLLWLILPGGEGLFVLDPGSNVESATDDHYRKIRLSDRDGNNLPNNIFSLTFDRDGYMWVGTSEGVLISYNPDQAIDASNFTVQRVKIPDVVQGLAAYLLQTEIVTSITVDGGNRKWFGTSKSGVFLQSSDGSKELLHFTTQNSPLPSNSIVDIKIHPTSGEVFIATDKGLISYRGDATEPGEKFGKVYAFPNPIKHGYSGIITITGLVENTTVKISDISGNLVYETQSQGGQAAWDGKNLNGNRVSTGVYLIFCSDSKGDQTAVSKLLFIK